MANVEHLETTAGEDRVWTLHARDSSNAVKDLTGCAIAWYVARPPARPDYTTALINKTGTTVSASAGTFTVSVAAADTQFLNGDYEHQAWCTDGSGNATLVSRGRFRVSTALVA